MAGVGRSTFDEVPASKASGRGLIVARFVVTRIDVVAFVGKRIGVRGRGIVGAMLVIGTRPVENADLRNEVRGRGAARRDAFSLLRARRSECALSSPARPVGTCFVVGAGARRDRRAEGAPIRRAAGSSSRAR